MTQAQYLVFMLFKPVFSGLVIGEDGTGQFTKGSEFMQAKAGILSKSLGSHGMVIGETALNGPNIQKNKDSEDTLPDLPELPTFSDFDQPTTTVQTTTETEITIDPNHQNLIKPEFKLVTEWNCSIKDGECQQMLGKLVQKMNNERENKGSLKAFEICESDYQIRKYGKAIRFSLHGRGVFRYTLPLLHPLEMGKMTCYDQFNRIASSKSQCTP